MCDQFSFNKITIFINVAPLKNPKIRKRWPILPFENNHFYKVAPRKFHIIINTFQITNEAIYIGSTRNAFFLKEIAIFFKIAPIKKSSKIMKNHLKSFENIKHHCSAFSLKEIAIFFKIAPITNHQKS